MMIKKPIIFCFIFSVFSLTASAQMKFIDGYIVSNNHEKIDCMIRNIGNDESAMNFEYRLKGEKEIKKIELSKIEQFGIEGQLKCIRVLIDIEVSPKRIKELKDTVQQWEKGHAFLKVLVEGNLASLYSYFHEGRSLFFYSTGNSSIKPLIYKAYYLDVASNLIHQQTFYNNTYRQQLKQYVSCEGNTGNLKKVSYTKKALVEYFINYHQCMETDYKNYRSARVNKGSLRLKINVTSNNNQLTIKEFSDALPNLVFSKENSIGFGAEAEYLLPFNNYKWSLFAESNLISYSSNTLINDHNRALLKSHIINYKAIEFPLGINRYVNISEDHRLFLRTALIPQVILSDAYIAFKNDFHYDLTSSYRFFIGGGYNFKRVGIEFRYYSPQNITQNIYKRGSRLSQISFRLFYTLFKTGK
jgi:hypothetical protein